MLNRDFQDIHIIIIRSFPGVNLWWFSDSILSKSVSNQTQRFYLFGPPESSRQKRSMVN